MAEFVYDAFLSYRRSDGGKTARWLRRELEAFRPPRALRDRLPQKLRAYLDTAYERGALDFFENTIRPALLASRFLITVATPDAVLRPSPQDDWIKREIDAFTAGPNGGNLLLVRGGGDFDGPLPADLAARFPQMEIIDLRNVSRFWRLNPLRASRISGELLKLIAPIAGVALEDMPLLRREQERIQQARLGTAVGAVLAILLAISGLTIYALITRTRATTALESTLGATGSLVLKLGGSDASAALSDDGRRNLVNDVCDLFDGLRKESTADARAGPLVVCFAERGKDHEDLKEIDAAEKSYRTGISESASILARSHAADDARNLVLAMDELSDFFERQKNMKALASSLEEGDPIIARLQADYPDQSYFPEARANRLQSLAGLEEQEPARQLATLDKAASLAGQAAQKQIREKQGRLLAIEGKVLMFAADAANRAKDADGALNRLKTAASTLDEAAALSDKPDQVQIALNGAAAYAMQAAVERARGHAQAAEAARAEGRKRLTTIDPSQLTEQSDRERLQSVGAGLAEPLGENSLKNAGDP
jgi:hypothetical protein